jgi:hypothetical protein
MKMFYLLTLAGSVFAQAPPPQPSNWVAAGGAFTSGASPEFSGIASFGVKLSGANTWSYTTVTVTTVDPKLLAAANANSVSVRTGIMSQVASFGSLVEGDPLIRLCTLADVGGSSPATGGIVGSFSGRGVAILRIRRTGWHAALDVGVVKNGGVSAPMVALLFGKGF